MAKKEKDVKEKKQNSSYFKDMKTELKKVVWPTPKELVNDTIAVIAFVICIGVIVFISDLAFDNLNKYGITVLQEKVRSSFQTTDSSENTTSENTTEEEASGENSTENVEAEVVEEGSNTSDEQNTSAEENSAEQNNVEDENATEANE